MMSTASKASASLSSQHLKQPLAVTSPAPPFSDSTSSGSSAFDIAAQVRRNAEEYKNSISELLAWEKDIKKKEVASQKKVTAATLATNASSKSALPPVRGANAVTSSTSPSQSPKTKPSSTMPGSNDNSDNSNKDVAKRISSSDYRAWDKFNPDQELERLEADEKQARSAKEERDEEEAVAMFEKQRELEAAAERQCIEDALMFKEKGNLYFKKADYKRAIQAYTKSIQLDSEAAVSFINRAMAYIKVSDWALAEADCSRGLELDSKNVKALWRRGIARRELGSLKDAKNDLETALVLNPTNKAVKEELDKVVKALKVAPSSSEKSITSAEVKRKRIPISEIGDAAAYKDPNLGLNSVDAQLKPVQTKSLVTAVSETTDKPGPASSKPVPDASTSSSNLKSANDTKPSKTVEIVKDQDSVTFSNKVSNGKGASSSSATKITLLEADVETPLVSVDSSSKFAKPSKQTPVSATVRETAVPFTGKIRELNAETLDIEPPTISEKAAEPKSDSIRSPVSSIVKERVVEETASNTSTTNTPTAQSKPIDAPKSRKGIPIRVPSREPKEEFLEPTVTLLPSNSASVAPSPANAITPDTKKQVEQPAKAASAKPLSEADRSQIIKAVSEMVASGSSNNVPAPTTTRRQASNEPPLSIYSRKTSPNLTTAQLQSSRDKEASKPAASIFPRKSAETLKTAASLEPSTKTQSLKPMKSSPSLRGKSSMLNIVDDDDEDKVQRDIVITPPLGGSRKPLIAVVGGDADAPMEEPSTVIQEVLPAKNNVAKIAPPPTFAAQITTLFDLEREWKSTKGEDSKLYALVRSIPPSQYAKLFKTSLEAHYVTAIIRLVRNFYLVNDDVEVTLDTLKGLSQVQRFDMNLMFLGRKEQTQLAEVFTELRKNSASPHAQQIADLAKKYRVKG